MCKHITEIQTIEKGIGWLIQIFQIFTLLLPYLLKDEIHRQPEGRENVRYTLEFFILLFQEPHSF